MLGGECLAIVEDEEVPLHRWEFLHCPPGTAHLIVGAGDGPATVLMVGGRKGGGPPRYPVSEAAARYGASVTEETNDPREAWAQTGLDDGVQARSAPLAALLNDRLFDTGEDEPRGQTHVPARDQPLAARMRPQTLDEFIGQDHLLGGGIRPPFGDRGGPAAFDGPLRPAGHRQDDARSPPGAECARGLRGGVRGERRQAGGPRRARARRAPPPHQR